MGIGRYPNFNQSLLELYVAKKYLPIVPYPCPHFTSTPFSDNERSNPENKTSNPENKTYPDNERSNSDNERSNPDNERQNPDNERSNPDSNYMNITPVREH